MKLSPITTVQAHKTELSLLSLNAEGTLLATASTKVHSQRSSSANVHEGTVIRVFSLPDASRTYTFRRGTYAANIYSINFSSDSTMICVSSGECWGYFKYDNVAVRPWNCTYLQNPSGRATIAKWNGILFTRCVKRNVAARRWGYCF